jgi:hypothetical protein
MRSPFKRPALLTNILIVGLAVPFALLWGELFTRVLLPQNVDSKMNIFASDPTVGFTFKPNARTYEKGKEYNALYEINSLGLRDREYGPKKEGIFRVLLLGDSFCVSHGLPIHDSLSRQMEKAMQDVADADGMRVKVEVINAAAGGYSPYNYWKAYQRWVPVFNPDAVIVGLSPDDYECDNNEDMQYLVENGEILGVFKNGLAPKAGRRLSIKKIRKWLSWNSEFYVLMRNYLYYSDVMAQVSLATRPGGIENDLQLRLYVVGQEEAVDKAWSNAFMCLERLRRKTMADGVALSVIPIPLKMEIDSAQYQRVIAMKGLKNGQIDLDQQLKRIAAFCAKTGIPILNPRQALRQHHLEVPCYFVLDGHWNAEGVRAAAISLAKQYRDVMSSPWTSEAPSHADQ